MIEFDDPEKKYILEGPEIRSKVSKVRIFTLFVLFIMAVIFVATNDFSFNFSEKDKQILEFSCNDENTYSIHESNTWKFRKAERAIQDNLGVLRELRGFKEASPLFQATKSKKIASPIIQIIVSEIEESAKQVPDRMCGFWTEVLYK